jgi:hypothetical protein
MNRRTGLCRKAGARSGKSGKRSGENDCKYRKISEKIDVVWSLERGRVEGREK